MILKNPENGAPIRKFASEGKAWDFPVDTILDFDDAVAADLMRVYGYLEPFEPEEKVLEILQEGGVFKCSACDYQNATKVAVIAHQRGHKTEKVEVKKAEPVGVVERRPTLFESRFDKSMQAIHAEDKELESDGWYGEGFVEERPGSHNIGGVPGRFGAAN